MATYDEHGAQKTARLVLRVKPTQHNVFMEADIESQYRVLEALGANTDVSVPTMRGLEADDAFQGAPFFVQDQVDGRAPTDQRSEDGTLRARHQTAPLRPSASAGHTAGERPANANG